MSEVKEISLDDLHQGVTLEVGPSYEIHVLVELGELHVQVREHYGAEPVADTAYTISGPHGVSLQGNTTAEGAIDGTEPCPIDHYDLSICGQTFKVESRPAGAGPVVVRVPEWPPEDPGLVLPVPDALR
jgi:hypothetical protein